MFSFFRKSSEPTQAEILLALMTLEIKASPEMFKVKIPSYSGSHTIIEHRRDGLEITCEVGLCGWPWSSVRINGLPIKKRELKTLIKLHEHCLKNARYRHAATANDILIDKLMERRRQRMGGGYALV